MRFVHWLMVKCRVLRIPVGSRVSYGRWDGVVLCPPDLDGEYKVELQFSWGGDKGYSRRRRLVFKTLPPRLSRFDRLVQSYIRSELRP